MTDTEHYWSRGYIHRLEILDADEVQTWHSRLEAIEAEQEAEGPWTERSYRPWDHPTHPLAEFVGELARHPKLLDAVETVLGPDLLIRNADIFVKRPGVRRGIGWHVDTALRTKDTDGMLTAWLGLTASSKENGCMAFSAGSHNRELPDAPKDKYTLTLSKTAAGALDPADTVLNLMDPGMASLHHFRMVHASGPNRSTTRRVGFVVRFMRPDVHPDTAESGSATLVRGRDHVGRFALKDRFPMSWNG